MACCLLRTVNIPKEVLEWDYDARSRYAACAKKGTQTMHRARAMIVGCAGAGKTTLLRRLQQQSIQELREIKSTVGLEVYDNLFEIDRDRKCLKGLEEDVDTENKCLLSVVDFAGQCAYYACHQVYLSRRAFYLLVIDMSKRFDEKVDQTLCEQEGTMFADWTFGEYVLFWLKSIHTYCEDDTPVVTIATHSDEVQDMVNRSIYDDLLELLKYEPDLRKHLDREHCFHIGFPKDDNEPLDKLTDIVECIASIALEDRWRENIPKDWAYCEVILRQNKQNGKKIISVTDFRKQVSIKKFGKGNETFDVLMFYHDIGAILYYNEDHLKASAITDVQWFVDCFKYIITDPKHARDLVENDKDWKNFFESGYLSTKLLTGIWKKKDMVPRKCNSTLKYMQRLGLLAKGPKAHYVPCMNKLDFEENLKDYITTLEQKTSVLVFNFRFLPYFFYFRLIVACIVNTEWTVIEDNGQKCLFKNIALFLFEEHMIGVAVTTSAIQVQIFRQGNRQLSGEITMKIKKTMEDVLEQMTKNFHKKTLYEIGYQCSKQNVIEEDALCFISEKELIGRGEFSCPNHGLKNHHIIKEKKLLLFWKYDSDNKANPEDCTTNAPIGKLPTQNYDIFSQLIDIARKSLQIYFDKIFPSKDVVSIFTKNKVDMEHGQYKFNKDQLAILFPANGTSPSSSAFDVTIMYKLLRNYGPNVQDPLVGWGNKPEVGKKSETDDVERIRYYRNKFAHPTDKTMDQEELDIFWKDLSQRA
ncbi:probable serine/threonine-protein kinase pats1 [Saccostrea cucullata]|uniref:probable serine/threonine-protein kinase pats1 n=1 Tax=Saccostrea cuccullata TaxID=36930 RepID=UPI002ED2C184